MAQSKMCRKFSVGESSVENFPWETEKCPVEYFLSKIVMFAEKISRVSTVNYSSGVTFIRHMHQPYLGCPLSDQAAILQVYILNLIVPYLHAKFQPNRLYSFCDMNQKPTCLIRSEKVHTSEAIQPIWLTLCMQVGYY